MELSKDEPIFKTINKINNYIGVNTIILKFHNNSDWTETEFNNFTYVLRNNYDEIINEEILEVSKDSSILVINKIGNILNYCNTNNHLNTSHKWENKEIIYNEKINNLFDIDLEFEVNNKTIFDNQLNWDNENKKFEFMKSFNYNLNNGIIAVATIIKNSNNKFNSLKESKILLSEQKYEFSLIINNTKNLINSIIIAIKALFLSNIILTKKQQQEIINSYSTLVKKDMQLPVYYKDIPLLTPKPITLEKINLVNPDDYGAISILRGYTVTEKADGERILMYINNKGNVYLINSSLKVEDTGIKAKKEAFNSLIDGEYIVCNKRNDNSNKNIYAAFDIYYFNEKLLTHLPLINGRNEELNKIIKLLDLSKSEFDFIIKTHHYTDNILNDCKMILNNPNNYPYDIDGLIFTPAKLAVYSFYPSMPVPINQNMGWDRLFKWKPPEQNTIDFLVKFIGDIKKDGIKYKKIGLYVGVNPLSSKEITIDEGLKLRYDKNYNKSILLQEKEKKKNKEDIIPILFKPIINYHPDVEFAFIKIDSKGDIRTENNEKIDNETIIEFRYNLEEKYWIPIRIREDKTRIYKKGILSKTANSLPVAINIWRSIQNPISVELITGATDLLSRDVSPNIQAKDLEADDIYYSRGIPRKALLSYNMITFHNLGINDKLFKYSKNKNSLLELACGQASDLSRWIANDYKFIFGIDFAKDNIYKNYDGAYARVINEFNRFNKIKSTEKGFFPNIVFAAGDCSLDIRSGASGVDNESKEIMKIVMNNTNRNIKPHYKHIAGKGFNKFDVVTCLFAIHYFFESEVKLEGFLNNVASNLKKNGIFICTFMDGDSVESALKNDGIIEGRKNLDNTSVLIWAIIKRFINDDDNYNKRIDVFIENTQKLIPEYLVNFNFLIKKAAEFGLELEETELYSETFKKFRDNINDDETKQSSLDKSLLELDKEDIQKKFSFLNRWVIFKKID